ncbi:hypothetical protein GGR56DRAFT_665075 [Xylariaceae sp. FL0804]|nr:hypothetical protein GGR56DRAFT_665075 [Xylariaceae sp. FL0804]
MSRSIDKDILCQLKVEDPKPAYDDISRVLTNLPPYPELLEIEFLGKSHPLEHGVNFIRDGLAVAIPRMRLLQAFSVAYQILRKHLATTSALVGSEVLSASAVILLMDPEHLTAANLRKRGLMCGKPSELSLRHEKQFVDTLLTARLHRHTKSPNLWSHRRWLMDIWTAQGLPLSIHHEISGVIMLAGERHPRNYVAWHHARFLVQKDRQNIVTLAPAVKEYCLRHHSDISAWSFLAFTISRINDEDDRRNAASLLLADVLRMTDSLRWTNESVWVFLRTILATEQAGPAQFESFMAINAKFSSAAARDTPQLAVLDRAQEWCRKHRA